MAVTPDRLSDSGPMLEAHAEEDAQLIDPNTYPKEMILKLGPDEFARRKALWAKQQAAGGLRVWDGTPPADSLKYRENVAQSGMKEIPMQNGESYRLTPEAQAQLDAERAAVQPTAPESDVEQHQAWLKDAEATRENARRVALIEAEEKAKRAFKEREQRAA